MIYHIASKTLKFNGTSYSAVSGPYGQDNLPSGDYTVKTSHVVVQGLAPSYCAGDVCFFIPITPQFSCSRHGLGIHPDGNIAGTEGCIGLSTMDAPLFWKAWMNMSLGSRPTKLKVFD
ncbi:MAG: hypothetical protein GY699_10595 [Desulfobacteraceae bacterium]|nr:hypothetical protein [Desulfobacteraceae bacterium]